MRNVQIHSEQHQIGFLFNNRRSRFFDQPPLVHLQFPPKYSFAPSVIDSHLDILRLLRRIRLPRTFVPSLTKPPIHPSIPLCLTQIKDKISLRTIDLERCKNMSAVKMLSNTDRKREHAWIQGQDVIKIGFQEGNMIFEKMKRSKI